MDDCYQLIGYPPWYKGKKKTVACNTQYGISAEHTQGQQMIPRSNHGYNGYTMTSPHNAGYCMGGNSYNGSAGYNTGNPSYNAGHGNGHAAAHGYGAGNGNGNVAAHGYGAGHDGYAAGYQGFGGVNMDISEG
ncbi:abscisic acid and environmental stress-inducible protein-like [Lycium barbarum]|uniref:abscisic acid and environmental stress-inducible protein-like n=1 Tax=Lycium barbarum TaxID=112863 RepID=UPI00293E129F|nr:abscisic acid and environmental stress-inducible protein-like [Lycium barbarum]